MTGSGTVTVVNHSNADVTAEATFAAESGLDGITGSFADGADNGDDSSEVFATGVGRTPDGADSNQFTLTISGNEEALSTVAGHGCQDRHRHRHHHPGLATTQQHSYRQQRRRWRAGPDST